MKNPVAISILIVGLGFVALYGWINRYEYVSNELSGRNIENTVSLVTRVNVYSGERCALIPPSIFLPYIERMRAEKIDEIMWCF
ncbi:MAG: hypothetical protein VB959_05625, partial [Rhodospirillales bacterium]